MKILTDPIEFWNMIDTEHSPHWPVVCVDLNGVLDEYKGYNGVVEFYPPAKGAREFLMTLSTLYKTVVVFTATIPIEDVAEWIEKHALSEFVSYVSNWKVPATVYIDDKAVTHTGNFAETLNKIRNFQPWWRDDNDG